MTKKVYHKSPKKSIRKVTKSIYSFPIPLKKPVNFAKFLHWIQEVFVKWTRPKKKTQVKIEPTSSTRIKKLEDLAHEVISQLQSAKEDLKHEVDSEVFHYVERVIDPMMKGVNRIQKITEIQDSEAEQNNVLEKYDQWISQAKQWVGVLHEKQTKIKEAILQHFAQLSSERINRDLRVIEDYKNHRLAELILNENEKSELSSRIDKALDKFLNPLKEMRKYQPESLTFEQVDAQQEIVALKRETYSNQALYAVDSVIYEVKFTNEANLLERENLLVNFREIENLEETLPNLLIEMKNGISNPIERHRLQKKLFSLEDEASELEDKIKLTPELTDRLDKIKVLLDEAHQYLAHS